MDLRFEYEELLFWEKELDSILSDDKETDDRYMNFVVEHVKKIKKRIRDEHKLREKDSEYKRVIRYDYDGFLEIVSLPDILSNCSEEEMVGFFERNVYIHALPSQYDCTGQLFTAWYKLFKRNGKWMAYHCVGCDV